jgi:hypothetical protein
MGVRKENDDGRLKTDRKRIDRETHGPRLDLATAPYIFVTELSFSL